jgi:predicted 2-oxoglutarate/Fe(II)-dependent dioxygenase YbiX
MNIDSRIGDKGLYVLDCVDREHLDKIFALENKLNSIEQTHFFRSTFTLSEDELSIYLKTNINAAIIEYLNASNKNKNDYISKNTYGVSNWILNKRMNPHIDTIKYDNPDTHNPRPIINVLLYLTDDYVGGEITFPEIDMVIKPKAGSVVIFDADLMHGVNEIKSGARKTLSSNLYSVYAEDVEEIKSNGWRTL